MLINKSKKYSIREKESEKVKQSKENTEQQNKIIETRTIEQLLRDLRQEKEWSYWNVVDELTRKGIILNEKTIKKWEYGLEYPDLDIRLVFQNANTKIHKGSKITYGAWAQKHGFKYASSSIPAEWLKETPTEESRQAFFIVTEKLESDR